MHIHVGHFPDPPLSLRLGHVVAHVNLFGWVV